MSTNDLASVTCRKIRRRKYLSPSRGLTVYILPMDISLQGFQNYTLKVQRRLQMMAQLPRDPLLRDLACVFHNLSVDQGEAPRELVVSEVISARILGVGFEPQASLHHLESTQCDVVLCSPRVGTQVGRCRHCQAREFFTRLQKRTRTERLETAPSHYIDRSVQLFPSFM